MAAGRGGERWRGRRHSGGLDAPCVAAPWRCGSGSWPCAWSAVAGERARRRGRTSSPGPAGTAESARDLVQHASVRSARTFTSDNSICKMDASNLQQRLRPLVDPSSLAQHPTRPSPQAPHLVAHELLDPLGDGERRGEPRRLDALQRDEARPRVRDREVDGRLALFRELGADSRVCAHGEASVRTSSERERREGERRDAQSGANPLASTPGRNFLTSSTASSMRSSDTASRLSQKSGTSSPSSVSGGDSHSTSGPKRTSPSRLSVRCVPRPESELQEGRASQLATSGGEIGERGRTRSPLGRGRAGAGPCRRPDRDLRDEPRVSAARPGVERGKEDAQEK